jgi:hypothetical protein
MMVVKRKSSRFYFLVIATLMGSSRSVNFVEDRTLRDLGIHVIPLGIGLGAIGMIVCSLLRLVIYVNGIGPFKIILRTFDYFIFVEKFCFLRLHYCVAVRKD